MKQSGAAGCKLQCPTLYVDIDMDIGIKDKHDNVKLFNDRKF